MRKILLASIAALGALGSAPAMAQYDATDSSYSNDGAEAPKPGTIVVRLNGRVRVYGGYFGDSDGNRAYYFDPNSGRSSNLPFNQTAPGYPTVPLLGAPRNVVVQGANGLATTIQQPGLPIAAPRVYNKQSDYGIETLVRLFPGFDGVATNGLKYGASVELRTDNATGAGGGVYGSVSKQTRQRGEVYLRRASGYVGTDKAGTLKFGGTDGPSGLFMVGNFENFNDGGWNGEVYSQLDQAISPQWPFADVGSVYSTNKVVYLSPQVLGFDFGAAFEPNTSSEGQVNGGNGCNGNNNVGTYFPGGPNVAGAGCDRLSSTSTGDYTRRKNTVDVGARYRGTFDDIGVAAYVDYVGGGKVLDQSPTTAIGVPGQRQRQYNGLSVVAGGAAITYAGFSVGGLIQYGDYNGANYVLKAQGQKKSTAWLAGGSYTVGPVIVGASYFVSDYAGASGLASSGFSPLVGQRRDRGVAAGGTYTVAPGLNLFLNYLWGDTKENGVDLVTGETAAGPAGSVRLSQAKVQLLTLGTSLTW